MYLIRQLSTRNGHVDITSGLEIVNMSKSENLHFQIINSFWGTSQIFIEHSADISKFEKIGHNFYLLPYANRFIVEGVNDFFKNFSIHVGQYDPTNIEGYILFVHGERNMITDGKKLYSQHPQELVVLLEDGQFLKFSQKRIRVEKDALLLEV